MGIVDAILAIIDNPTVAAILGVIIGSYITYFIGVRLDKRRQFERAAARFRNAFVNELRLLDSRSLANKDGKNAFEIITDAIDKHEIAKIKFRPYLTKMKRKRFDLAWEEYCCYHKETDRPFLEKYFDAGDLKKRAENITLAKQRIKKLLSFTE